MTTEEQQLFKALLELLDKQNEAIKECNNAFKHIMFTIGAEHQALEKRVKAMRDTMMKIKAQFDDTITV